MCGKEERGRGWLIRHILEVHPEAKVKEVDRWIKLEEGVEVLYVGGVEEGEEGNDDEGHGLDAVGVEAMGSQEEDFVREDSFVEEDVEEEVIDDEGFDEEDGDGLEDMVDAEVKSKSGNVVDKE